MILLSGLEFIVKVLICCLLWSCFVCCRISEDVQKFEVLVYPRDDSDAVTVTRSDFEMLEPMGFLSDSVIDFYIK